MSWTHRAYQVLNRPGLRSALGAAATMRATILARRFCSIRYEQNAWVHRFPDAVLVEPHVLPVDYSSCLEKLSADAWAWRYRPKAGDTVIDAGAGSGWTAIFFSRLVGTAGKVVAIEAHPGTFRCLQRTAAVNNLENVLLVERAVDARHGQILITDGVAFEANTTQATSHGIRVSMDSLDAILAPLHLPRIDLLKMNIEGAEVAAITAMAETIRKTRHVCVACHDFVGMKTKAKVTEFLANAGFEIATRDEDTRSYIRDIVYGSRTRAALNALDVIAVDPGWP